MVIFISFVMNMSTTKAIRYLTCFEYRISCTVRWTCAETLFVHFAWATNISCPPILRMRPVRVFSVINRKRKLFIDFSTFDKRRNFCVLSFIFFLFFHFSTNIFFFSWHNIQISFAFWGIQNAERLLTNVMFDISTRSDKFTAFNKLIPPHWLR